MSLAFPAIATQIVRKRLIREWFRQTYGLPDRPGSTTTELRGVPGRLRIAFEHSLDEEPGDPEANRDGCRAVAPSRPAHTGRCHYGSDGAQPPALVTVAA